MKKLFKSKFYKSLEPIIGKCNQKTHTITSRLFQHEGIIYDFKRVSNYIMEASFMSENCSSFDYWDIAYNIEEDRQVSLHQFVCVDRNLLQSAPFGYELKMSTEFLSNLNLEKSTIDSIFIDDLSGFSYDKKRNSSIVINADLKVLQLADIDFISGKYDYSDKSNGIFIVMKNKDCFFSEKTTFKNLISKLNNGDSLRAYTEMGLLC